MNVKASLAKNQLPILSASAIAGIAGVGILSALAGYKIGTRSNGTEKKPLLKKLRENPMQFAKDYVLPYIPAVLSATVAIASVIYTGKVYNKKIAAAQAVAVAATESLSDYRKAVKETLPREEREKVEKKVAEKRAQEKSSLIVQQETKMTFREEETGRLFKSTINEIQTAALNFNRNLMYEPSGWLELNEFYNLLCIPESSYGDIVGFSKDLPLELDFDPTLDTTTGEVIIDLIYLPRPYERH